MPDSTATQATYTAPADMPVKFFSAKKGYGFLINGDAELFFHINGCKKPVLDPVYGMRYVNLTQEEQTDLIMQLNRTFKAKDVDAWKPQNMVHVLKFSENQGGPLAYEWVLTDYWPKFPWAYVAQIEDSSEEVTSEPITDNAKRMFRIDTTITKTHTERVVFMGPLDVCEEFATRIPNSIVKTVKGYAPLWSN